jgi:hypothetical protein
VVVNSISAFVRKREETNLLLEDWGNRCTLWLIVMLLVVVYGKILVASCSGSKGIRYFNKILRPLKKKKKKPTGCPAA